VLVVLTTVASDQDAKILADAIVVQRLAACVQILPPMLSVYYWEGKVQSETEVLLLIKTVDEKFSELETYILTNHPYDVPEVVAIPASKVSQGYRSWLMEYLN
jgi:periplasmic divalent cation tolerance protein